MKRTLLALAITAVALSPLAAHAQTVTVSHHACNGGGGSATSMTCAAAGSVAVGDVVETQFLYFGNATPSATDTLGNTGTVEALSTVGSSAANVGIARFPITHAGSADSVTVSATTFPYANMDVVTLVPPTGYTLAGMDFANASPSISGDVMSLSGTASQANDLVLSAVYIGVSNPTLGSGQTVLDAFGSSSSEDSYTQPSASGSVTHTYTQTGAPPSNSTGAIIGEKVTATALTVSVSPTSFTPASCPMASGAAVATATAAGGDGNPVTYSLASGGDPSLSIGSSTGAITSNGSTTVCGNSYSTTVQATQN